MIAYLNARWRCTGAVYARESCFIDVQGNTYVNDNTAVDKGGELFSGKIFSCGSLSWGRPILKHDQ